jgi:hypothetical protein
MWGMIIYGAAIIGGLSLISLLAAVFAGSRKRWAKKQAKRMLAEGRVDTTAVEKTLQILAEKGKDLETQSLFRQLYSLRESKE